MTNRNGLLDAAAVLEDLAAGRTPARVQLLAGALTLDALRLQGPPIATSSMPRRDYAS